MSWDAELRCSHGLVAGDWNYTHNTSDMIRAAFPDVVDGPWYAALNGCSGEMGAALLAVIVHGLEADPERFRAMDPPNKWGSYDSLLVVLREMRDRSAAFPDGVWETSG